MRNSAFFLAWLLASVAGASAAFAADATGAQKQAPAVQKFDNWVYRCFPVETEPKCDVYQALTAGRTGRRVLSVSIALVPASGKYIGQFIMPLGVSLSHGAFLITDTYRSPQMHFRRCTAEGCIVEGEMGGPMVEALTNANKAQVELAAYKGKTINIPFSVKGFPAALWAMKSGGGTGGRDR